MKMLSPGAYGLFCLAACLLLTSCSDRDRLNPLDPLNPYTSGAPTGLSIYSAGHTAYLSWNSMNVDNMLKYYVYRSKGSASLSKYDSVSATSVQYVDISLSYDVAYSYAIQAVTQFDKSIISEAVSIVPGPYNIVLADYYDQSIVILTYDGKQRLARYDHMTPTDLIVINDAIVFTNLWDNSLKIIRADNSVQSVPLGDAPVDLAYNAHSDILYVLLRDQDELALVSPGGTILQRIKLAFDILFYTSCEYDSQRDVLWLTDNAQNKIYRYDFAAASLIPFSENIVEPNELAIDAQSGRVWIATRNGIFIISQDNSSSSVLPDVYIYDVDYDKLSGRLYYAGYHRKKEQWETGYLNEQLKNTLVAQRNYVYKIKAIRETDGTGLLLADGQRAQTVRINSNGEEIGRYRGAYGIIAVDLLVNE